MAKKLLLGTRKGVIEYQRESGDWQFSHESFHAQTVSYAVQDPRHGTQWAALDHGHWGQKLHRSDDGGKTWAEIPLPKYPDGALMNARTADGSLEQAAKLTYLWLIQPGPADRPNRLYLGTEPGGVFQSDDGGETFSLIDSLWNVEERMKWWFGGGRDAPGACSICVDPRDSRHILVGVSVGGVYESRDEGATWLARNQGLYANYLPDPYSPFGHDPHFMQINAANPDVVWQQNHCGVFRSTDSGATWQNISQPEAPAYFGFAVASDPKDADTAWIVPAVDADQRTAVLNRLCVTRTTDGGKTWTALRNGLPQENTYDLVFRHALDFDGQTLMFGTTTGNLYCSDDRGESWRCISHNLPPIYSVRFA